MSDRISELPDAIIGQILSLLETKFAVSTTAWSKRWENLVWNSLSNLHFDESSFSFSRESDFTKFIYHVLDRRDKTLPLHKLIFISTGSSGSYHKFTYRLLDYAIKSGVKHLEISIPASSPYRFSAIQDVLSREVPMSTLRILKLNAGKNGRPEIDRGTLSCLYNLEILHLRRFKIDPVLFSESVSLVELSIVSCEIWARYIEEEEEESVELIICVPQLASLTIFDCNITSILLQMPKLTSFKLKAYSYAIPDIQLTNEFVHLNTAIVNIRNEIEEQESTMNILQKLSHAQHLTLSLPILELLRQIDGAEEAQLSPFSNLKTLRITTKETNEDGEVIIQRKSISMCAINQVLNTVFQSSYDVGSFIDLPRPSKRPRN